MRRRDVIVHDVCEGDGLSTDDPVAVDHVLTLRAEWSVSAADEQAGVRRRAIDRRVQPARRDPVVSERYRSDRERFPSTHMLVASCGVRSGLLRDLNRALIPC